MHEIEMTCADLLKLGVRLGLIADGELGGVETMIKLVDDNNWTYTETERRLLASLPGDATIMITPKGHFLHGDSGPLLDLLRKGKADAELQAWIADMIERDAFASRKTWMERVEALGALGEAVEDFSFVRELLRERGPRRGAHKWAMRVVSLRYEVPLEKLEEYFKRGAKDRHRLVKILRAPFAID